MTNESTSDDNWAQLRTIPAQGTKGKMKLQTNRDFVSVAQTTHVFLLTETAKKIKHFPASGEVKL